MHLLRSLLGLHPEDDAELVAIGNIAAAAIVSGLAWWQAQIPGGWAIALGGLAYLSLNALLLSRRTWWISALAGGLYPTLASTVLFASLGANVADIPGAYVGGIVGLGIGVVVSYVIYADVSRSARERLRPRRHDDP